ncbi:hypothetical protein NDK47_00965 [Brevibacillus ruminantium]|uniref:Uncharacterized protein n=1 Tax=Brevibacillus ruminantium TaxID=2950604 RepID=A0ABY4WFM5_9BACL|nr:hypothetical protein [Brevibacillus ruminantium]USG65960.1 hypothetical protein NDK47_00965 [Brevibacillus ruminantium]
MENRKKFNFKLLIFLSLLLLLISCQSNNVSSNSTVIDIEKFNKKYLGIKTNFTLDGYIEITEDWAITNLVPTFTDSSELDHSFFEGNNKTLVYKNESKGIVVMVGLSPGIEEKFQWKNALYYSPNFYNAINEDSGITKGYSEIYPNTTVGIYNFSGKELNVSIVLIGDNSKVSNKQIINSEFLPEFIKYIENNI